MHLNLPNVDLTAGHGSFSCHIVAVYTSSLDPQMEAGNIKHVLGLYMVWVTWKIVNIGVNFITLLCLQPAIHIQN